MRIVKDKIALSAALFVLGIILVAIMAPLISPYDPLSIDLDSLRMPPSFHHPLGTDNKGRDVLSRILYGARLSLFVSVTATVVSMTIGLFIGLASGYIGGKVDSAITMLIDIVMAFPSLLLAIAISAVLPPGLYTVIIALGVVGWASFARLMRSTVLTIRELPYVEAAKALGCSGYRVALRHILPNAMPIAIVVSSLRIGGFILAEASLSFLGLGAQPPTPTWGSMISTGRVYILSAPWMVIAPGLAIAVTTVSFNILGDHLRDALDPNLRV
ncbi:MAG: ABC transporter permease [Deltaproteobacteria bacterium]|nr:ABC transporter permease [Deltaproteobacteria bacterium]